MNLKIDHWNYPIYRLERTKIIEKKINRASETAKYYQMYQHTFNVSLINKGGEKEATNTAFGKTKSFQIY